MQVLEQGGSVVLEAEEWMNETSGRGDLRLIGHPADGGDAVEGRFTVFLGSRSYIQALPELFPWADLRLDEVTMDDSDEDRWMEETAIWDTEKKRYGGNTQTFDEWLAIRYPSGELRPHSESAGEFAHWRLRLDLNELGRGVLALERYLSTS